MKTHAKVVLLLIVALFGVTQVYRSEDHSSVAQAQSRLLALDPTRVITTSTRSTNVQSFCPGVTRTTLITDAEIATAAGYFSTLKMYFNVDPVALIKSALSFDVSGMLAQGQNAMVGLGVYVVPFVIGLILSLTMWTCLCCCCTCPGCCPSKCCQHDENTLYTKCEMMWPVLFLMIVLLLACAAAVPGITRASTLADSIKTMECGVSLAFDDLMNGNITSDNATFFMGTSTLYTYLLNFKGNITDIINNFTAAGLQTPLTDVNSNLTSILSGLETLANGTANNSYVLSYTNPVPSAGAVPSAFPTVLGNPTDASTVVGGLYSTSNTLATAISGILAATASINGVSGTITTGIQTAADAIANFSSIITTTDSGLAVTFGVLNPYLEYVRYAFLGYYGAVIGLSVIALLGLIIMACFDKAGCRHLMYVACIIMLIACIVGFLLSFFLSVIIPILYMTCSIINPALDSSASFANVTASLNLPANITDIVKVCLPGGGGAILNQFGSVTSGINTQIGNVQGVMANISTYSTYDLAPLATATAAVTTLIGDYSNGRRNDITYNPACLTWFQKVANRSYPAACAAPYTTDSLIPSDSALSTASIPCATGATAIANGTCTNFGATGTCATGCIDMENVMSTAGSAATFTAYFGTRYAADACTTTISGEFTTVYNNWYAIRTNAANGIPSIATKWTPINTKFGNVQTQMAAAKTAMASTYTTLNGSISNLVDPTYGMVAGVNCLLIGEDLKLTKNTICVTLFNSFYFLFMTIGCASFALLFSMCCIVCTGVRHYKQSQKKNGKAIPEDGSNIGLAPNQMNRGMPMYQQPVKGYY